MTIVVSSARRVRRFGGFAARATTMTLTALILAGCASNRVAVEPTPAPAIASAWQAPLPATTAATASANDAAAATAQWWAGFGDPLLPTLIEAAQAASPNLSSAASRIEQARAARTAAAGALLPQLGAQGSIARARSQPGQPDTDTASIGLQAAWELDLFGGRRAGRTAAGERLIAAEATWHAARTALAAEVGAAYVGLRACEAQLEQTAADSASREQTERLTEASLRAGVQAPASAALARASAAQGRAQVAQQRAVCEAQVKALVALTAIDEPSLRQRLGAAAARQPATSGLTVNIVPAALLERRPDLIAASRAVGAAAADRAQADAQRLPQVSLSGSIGALRISNSFGTTDGSVWSIGPLAVSLPLFDGGTRAANQRAARAAYDDAVVQLQGAVRQAVREVEEALVSIQSAAAQEADARIAVEGFEAALKAAEARWRGGVSSLYELEDARRTAVAARSSLIELQRARATAWINLYRSLGGGFTPGELKTAAAN